MSYIKILGHRGVVKDNNHPYQNTIEAVKEAIEKEKADGVEIDVFSSLDDKIYVIHDDNISLHSDQDVGLITSLTSKEVNCKRVGYGKSYKIPSLKSILYLFRDKYLNKDLNIEIKQEGIAKQIMKEIKESEIDIKRISISSFFHEELKEIRKLNSKLKLGILYDGEMEKEKEFFSKIKRLIKYLGNAISLNPNYKTKNNNLLFLDFFKYIWTVDHDKISDAELKEIITKFTKVNFISNQPIMLRKKIDRIIS